MTFYIIVSALVFVFYLQTGIYMLWKNHQAPLNRWFFAIAMYLAAFALVSSLYLKEGAVGIQANLIRFLGWGVLMMLLFRFHSILTGYPRNRVVHDAMFFFFIVFGAGSTLFMFAVLYSFESERLYLLEDWFWTNHFMYAVYYLLLAVLIVLVFLMFSNWKKGFIWRKEKRRFETVFFMLSVVAMALMLLRTIDQDHKILNYLRMPHFLLVPWFVSIGYGFVHYRFLSTDPAKASRKLLLELKQLLFFCDQHGHVLETNPFSAQLSGVRIAEIREGFVQELFVEKEEIAKLIHDTKRGGDGGPVLVSLRNKHGGAIPVLLSATLLIDKFDDHYGIALYGTDQREAMALKQEIIRRRLIESSLQSMSGDLEVQVERNTEALMQSLKATTEKIAERKKVEESVLMEIADMEIMMGEIHTRVKKNIGIILALMQLHNKKSLSHSVRIRKNTLHQRIHTIFQVNAQILTHNDYGMVNFKSFLESLLREYQKSWEQAKIIRFDLKASAGLIWVDQAIPLAMVVNELVNNTIRHAFVSTFKESIVEVIFSIEDQKTCTLMVKDNGRGFVPEDQQNVHDYSGLQLVKMLVEDQLSGNYSIRQDRGVCVEIVFSLDQQRQGHLGVNS